MQPLDPELLDPELRRLVDAAKTDAGPDPRTHARVLASIVAGLPAGPTDGGPSGTDATPASASPVSGLGSLTTLKLLVGGAIGTAAVAAAVTFAAPGPAPIPPATTTTTSSAESPPRMPDPAPAASLPPTIATPSIEPTPTTTARGPEAKPRTTPPPSTPTPPPSALAPSSAAGPDPIRAELELVAAAEAALARGDDREALGITRTHRERHPEGQLALERDAIAAAAACGLHEPGAAKTAAAFLAAHPDAAASAKVRARCVDD